MMNPAKRQATVKDLEALLDKFSAKHKGPVQVRHDIVDITDCFLREGKWIVPRSFGYDGSTDFRVVATVARGYPFVRKYATDEQGHVKWTYASGKNVPELVSFGDDFRVIACLCGGPLQNTTTGELGSVISHSDKGQGFRRYQLKNVLERLQEAYGGFSFVDSSAFMFAGRLPEIPAMLHNLWLEQIIETGSKALKMMSDREARLIGYIYSPPNNITEELARPFVYRRDNPLLRVDESGLFIYAKLQSYQRFRETRKR